MAGIILWVYIVLLISGGVMGFVKAKSKASLIASLAFGLPLILTATGTLPSIVATVCLVLLLIFFGKKYLKGKQFMPSGLMTAASAIALLIWLLG